jgi:hypothetical protein
MDSDLNEKEQQKKIRSELSYIDDVIDNKLSAIFKKFDDHATRMENLFEEKLNAQREANKQFLSALEVKMNDMKEDIEALKKEQNNLQSQLSIANDTIKLLQSSSSFSTMHINDIEQFNMRNDVFIDGLPKMTADDVDTILDAFGTFVKCDLSPRHYEYAFPVKSNDKYASAIKIRFKSFDKKAELLKNFKKFQFDSSKKFTPVVVADFLKLDDEDRAKAAIVNINVAITKATRNLFNAARKFKKQQFKNVWIDHSGNIKASLFSGKIIRITSTEDLQKYRKNSKNDSMSPTTSK